MQDIDATKSVVSPKYKKLDSEVRKEAGKLGILKRQLGELLLQEIKLNGDNNKGKLDKIEVEKIATLTDINLTENILINKKKERKETPLHIEVGDLPEKDQFKQIASPAKHFVDTLKMIAYRAETAMAVLVRPWLCENSTNVRTVLKGFCKLDADIIVDENLQILNLKIHTASAPRLNHVLQKLCEHLNDTEFTFPGTNYKLKYSINCADKFDSKS